MPVGIYKHHKNQGYQRGHKPFVDNRGSKNGMYGKVPWNKGKHCFQLSNENHGEWKGDNVGYYALHIWIKRKLGKPIECFMCGCSSKIRRLHWANVDHKYKRYLNDWITFCYKCHYQYDFYILGARRRYENN